MALRDVRITLRDRQTTGGSVPSDALFGEPFINIYNGVLRFSGVTGGDYESSSQSNVFEVGSSLYNQKISNRLSINDNFIISGDTGFISTYGGLTGAGLVGKFLSGTSAGFVVANITDIQGVQTTVQPGSNITTGGTATSPIINVVSSPSFNNITYSGTSTGGSSIANNVSATTFYSAGTNLTTVINNAITAITSNLTSTRVQNGVNTYTGGTPDLPTVNIVDSPSFNNVTYSGTSIGGSSIANNVSATTRFYSAGTNLETIIYNIAASTENITHVQPGSNITTGGTATEPIINLSSSPSINNLSFSGTATGGNVYGTSVSGGTLYSGSTNLSSIFVNNVSAGSNISISGPTTSPVISVIPSPTFAGLVSATGFTDSSLTQGRVVYVGTSGRLVDEAGFAYNDSTDTLSTNKIVVGVPGQTGTTATIHGSVLILGDAISGFTSELYIEDNNIYLNYNPTGDTSSTSLGAGFTIQDGQGTAGNSVFFDVRGTTTGAENRSFATNLNDIRIRETGTVSAPNGVRVLAESDILDGGSY